MIDESTVYPGATEDVCVPILERESGSRFNAEGPGAGFCYGYSPERINPGDTEHKLITITKVTSGSTAAVAADAQHQFTALPADHWRQRLAPHGVLLDLKGRVPRELEALRL